MEVDLRKDVEGVEVEACLEIDQKWIVDSRCLLHAGLAENVVQRVKMNEHGIERMVVVEYEVQEIPFQAAVMKHQEEAVISDLALLDEGLQ